MKARLCFVPPDGGEIDYSYDVELPALPSRGDYISIKKLDGDHPGTEDFVVRRIWWQIEPGGHESIVEVMIECEFALGHYSTEDHKRGCEMYKSRTGKIVEFDSSMY